MTVATFKNGVQVLNCTPHEIRFQDGDSIVTVEPCGAKINARPQEQIVSSGIPELVKTVFLGDLEGEAEIAVLKQIYPKALLVGSIISAQAYPGKVVGMIPAIGFERVPPNEKLMRSDKFTIF